MRISEQGCIHRSIGSLRIVVNPYRDGWKPTFRFKRGLYFQFALNRLVITWWTK